MSLDQFYTKNDVAKKCFDKLAETILLENYDILLEPSAGTGSFFNLLDREKREGIDLDPKHIEVKKMNFFDYMPVPKKKYVVIGNPPFGKVSSLAVLFFNKAAEFADIIAFIIPRTFKRVSIQNKLNPYFELVSSEDLPTKPCCFEPKMDAKCCFQIWKRTTEKRNMVIYDKTHKDFVFLKHGPRDEKGQPTPATGADFVMKAYGSNCGEIVDTGLDRLRPKSWHWIKSNINVELLKQRFETLDYSMSEDTVRQNSIGQQEVISLYKQKYG